MEDQKIIKKIIRKPVEGQKSSSQTLFQILNVIMFIMVFIIFVRGFNIKGTVREERENTVKQLTEYMDLNRQVDKNEILSAFALYSRLTASELKEKELYHTEQQNKYATMASQFNKGLTDISKTLQTKKDTTK